jgi:PncC family amidohydrolase
LLGAALTSLPGSSAYMVGGVIAYSNALKTDLLGVDAGLIASHGAVSADVAAAMAAGVRDLCHADLGVAITGVAGPDGSEAKPAGLIYLCCSSGAGAPEAVKLEGDRGRDLNRRQAVDAALRLIAHVAGRH